jgi:CBS domain-containing protein
VRTHTVRTVADVMSAPVVTALPDETVAVAAFRMNERSVGSVVVVDGDRPVGILTERDVVRLAASGQSTVATKVAEWMTRDPDVIPPSLSVQEALVALDQHGYRHVPVVESGELRGIVSMRDLMHVAAIQPVVHPGEIEAPPGLEGVIVAETQVGDVRGLEGFYHYRQYSAVELADKRSLEDVWFLLFEGHLPTAAESRDFAAEVRAKRAVPGAVRGLLPDVAASGGSMMDQLRSAVSLIGHTEGFRPWLDVPTTSCAPTPSPCAPRCRR